MDLLDAKTRAYDWGTTDAIAELQGRPVPAPGPEAELWMGAHPTAPSVVRETTLDALIDFFGRRSLGSGGGGEVRRAAAVLLKVLSAARALSIRCTRRGRRPRKRLAVEESAGCRVTPGPPTWTTGPEPSCSTP
jgi:mannose-6-phosphate isomerase